MTESLIPQTPQSSQDPQIDPTKSYLNELINSGRYDSPEAVARAKVFGDEHIRRVEAENKQLRDDVLRFREENIAKQKLEDLIDQLQGRRTETPPQDNKPIVPQEKAIDTKDIESLIENKLRQTELTRTYNQNLQTVQQKLKEKYGEDYIPHYKQQIESLYLSKEEADELARRKPDTFMRMLGIDQPKPVQPQYQPPLRNTNQPMSPQAVNLPEKRDWAYYENLRKTNRSEYLSQKTQLQMLQDRMEQGEAFENSGFDRNLGGTR